MARQHYIPAAFLALFSNDKTTTPGRNRKLFVGDKRERRVFAAKAHKVAAINDLYGEEIGTWPPASLEKVWTGYEGKLVSAVESLVDGTIDARTWARVLVPFVSGLLIRGPDFDTRYERRLKELGVDSIMDLFVDQNTNGARVIEWNRLLAPVLASRWIISHVESDTGLITNDLGFVLIGGSGSSERGLAIPLTDSCSLILIPQMDRVVLRANGDGWDPEIEHEQSPLLVEDTNAALATAAQRFIFGRDEGSIQGLIDSTDETWPPPEPIDVGFMNGRYMRAHEYTWHRLVGVVETPPTELGDEIKFDVKLVASGWAPPVNLVMGLHRFPSALFRHADEIVVRFYDPEYQYSKAGVKRCESQKDFDGVVEEATQGLNVATTPDEKKEMLWARASALLKLQKPADALDDMNAYLELDPTSTRALLTKGCALLELGDPEASLALFEEAISLSPEFANAWVYRGLAYLGVGKHEAAYGDFSSALTQIKEDPQRASVRFSRARACLALGDTKGALEDATAALEGFPEQDEKVGCLLLLSEAHLRVGSCDEALDASSAAVGLEPENAQALLLRAHAHRALGDKAAALADVDVIIQLSHDDEERRAVAVTVREAFLADQNNDGGDYENESQ